MTRRRFVVGVVSVLAAGATTAVRANPPPHEQGRIDRLIRYVESQKDMKFIRNGSEYSCAEAARFLRGKLETLAADITTAREFIERVATKSSMSGQPYHVKFGDGRLMPAAQFLSDELKRIEAHPA
jgi:hypothetical protein